MSTIYVAAEPIVVLSVEQLRKARSREGLHVIAIGPRGGRIVGYDSHHDPIYEGSAAAKTLAEARHGTKKEEPESQGGGTGVLASGGRGQGKDRSDHEGSREGAGREKEKASAQLSLFGGTAHPPITKEVVQDTGAESRAEILLEPAPARFERDDREWTPPKSPAIALHEDLLPEITSRLPDEIKTFPNPSGGLTRLFPHQVDAAERILTAWDKGDGALLASDAGLGKTLAALAAISARGGKRNLIVVPTSGKATLKAQWASESGAKLYGIDLRDGKETPEGEGTWIVAYDELVESIPTSQIDEKTGKPKTVKQLRSDLGNQWDTVVFDESHSMTKRGGVWATAGIDLQGKAEKVLYMSATPYTNIEDMHYLVKLGEFRDAPSFLEWAQLVGAEVKGKEIKNPSSPLPMAAIAATFHVDGKAIKHTTSLEGMTSGFDQMSKSELSADAVRTFEEAGRIVDIAVDAGVPESLAKAFYTSWSRQYWETQKVDKAIAAGKKALEEGKQIAFFTSYKEANHMHLRAFPRMLLRAADREAARDNEHRSEALRETALDLIRRLDALPPVPNVIETLTEAFGGSSQVAEIHGNTKKSPAAEQDAYQRGEKRVVVATMAKGGTGISLHDTKGDAPRVQINLSLPWSGREFVQVAGRSHRLGSKSETHMHWVVGDAAMEQHNAAIVAKRLKSMGALTTGDPEFTADASALAEWEFGSFGTASDSDDAADDIRAIEVAAEDAGVDVPPLAQKTKAQTEAQAARDYFREFAEARRSGRNVLQEESARRQTERQKKLLLEARRSAEQVRQKHGYRPEFVPDEHGGGKFVVPWRDVPFEHNRTIKSAKVKGRQVNSLREFHLSPESMVALAKQLGADKLSVDMNDVARKERENKATPKIEDTADLRMRFRTKDLNLLEKTLYPESDDPVHVITGKTFPVKETIKKFGGRFNNSSHGAPSWEVRRSKLEALLSALGVAKGAIIFLAQTTLEFLRKATKGEESRGGRVIGHTASGKAVYAPSSRHKGRSAQIKRLQMGHLDTILSSDSEHAHVKRAKEEIPHIRAHIKVGNSPTKTHKEVVMQALEAMRDEAKKSDFAPDMLKGGPYVGPRGGKWADPEHTIPWKEGASGSNEKMTREDADKAREADDRKPKASRTLKVLPAIAEMFDSAVRKRASSKDLNTGEAKFYKLTADAYNAEKGVLEVKSATEARRISFVLKDVTERSSDLDKPLWRRLAAQAAELYQEMQSEEDSKIEAELKTFTVHLKNGQKTEVRAKDRGDAISETLSNADGTITRRHIDRVVEKKSQEKAKKSMSEAVEILNDFMAKSDIMYRGPSESWVAYFKWTPFYEKALGIERASLEASDDSKTEEEQQKARFVYERAKRALFIEYLKEEEARCAKQKKVDEAYKRAREQQEKLMAQVEKEASKSLSGALDLIKADDANNPWAICTASTGRGDKDKYERCVQSVKSGKKRAKKSMPQPPPQALSEAEEILAKAQWSDAPYDSMGLPYDYGIPTVDPSEIKIEGEAVATPESEMEKEKKPKKKKKKEEVSVEGASYSIPDGKPIEMPLNQGLWTPNGVISLAGGNVDLAMGRKSSNNVYIGPVARAAEPISKSKKSKKRMAKAQKPKDLPPAESFDASLAKALRSDSLYSLGQEPSLGLARDSMLTQSVQCGFCKSMTPAVNACCMSCGTSRGGGMQQVSGGVRLDRRVIQSMLPKKNDVFIG